MMANAEPRSAAPAEASHPPASGMARAGWLAAKLHHLPPAVPALGLHLPIWALILRRLPRAGQCLLA